ncbi:MFS transporter [Ruegeria sp. 2012CJ41-6]|uniref:MFS transporter n=1 Tax=Ruegeria spongiae TaxID=2942209 RepID=A0ABT0Q698_9RHOB|nr:MFS transporter [Ruegeria spongiae]MCL6285087.1 MFS transporter [Ruegeria spongiae]
MTSETQTGTGQGGTAPLNRPLLGINFFAGDVTAGFGPYLAIYLLAQLHWSPQSIGFALALGSIVTVIAQTPAGALIDWTSAKRGLMVACISAVGVAALTLVITDSQYAIYGAQATMGVALAFLGPLIAAITLGVVGRQAFTRQTSANQAWNHAGNVVAAAIAAGLALAGFVDGVFILISVMCLGMIFFTALIKPSQIDHEAARGGVAEDSEGQEQPSGFATILSEKRLIIFGASIILFHFANASMLPLVSQKVASGGDTKSGIAFTSACIISAQFIMIAMAILCGKTADIWGRKPLFLMAFSILPIRALLYTLTDNSVALVAIQSLDGVANGIFAVLFLLIVSDVTKGTGRFNVAQGALATLVGVGASASNLIAEEIVQIASYDMAFYFLAGVAVLGALIFAFLMPETARHARRDLADSSHSET